MKNFYICVFFTIHTLHGTNSHHPHYKINEKFFLGIYLKKNNEEVLLKYLEKKEAQEYIASQTNILPWILERTTNSRLIHHLISYGKNFDYNPHAFKKLLKIY